MLVVPKDDWALRAMKIRRVQTVMIASAVVHDRHQVTRNVWMRLITFTEHMHYKQELRRDGGPDAVERVVE